MSLTASVCRKLYSTLREFDERILGEKLSAGLCEFNDIRRFVLSPMIDENGEPTPLALDYRDRFDRIYIDEYQDVDEVQDMIFRAISRDNNRFMVGDIKQSIYSFRGAEPSIFAGYKKTMPVLDGENKNESDCFSIFMSENFRCDKNVVDFTNLVSS
jgi:ATP-dependent helicase/nuclease subunit A